MDNVAHEAWGNWSAEAPASIRSRFVQRAKTLVTDQSFCRDLDHAISTWNETYPHLALSTKRGDAPDGACLSGQGYLYPPKLQALWGDWQPILLITPEFCIPPDREPTADDILAAQGAKVPIDWHNIVEGLWLKWWPAAYFPNWARSYTSHPCQEFIGACLIWNPLSLDPERWVERHPAKVSWTVCDLSGAIEKPEPGEVYYEALYRRTMERLQVAIRSGEQITETVLEREAWAANEDAERARNEALQVWAATTFPYVWLYPGLNSADWRALESRAIAAANRGSNSEQNAVLGWKDHARRMYADDPNKSKIARELGVTWDQVHNLLEGV